MSKVACTKMAMSRLPFVLLKTHVMMMVKAVAEMTNRTMLRRVGGKFQAGTQNKGRCHNAQRGAEDQAPDQRTIPSLQPRQRKPAPPRLFAQRSVE